MKVFIESISFDFVDVSTKTEKDLARTFMDISYRVFQNNQSLYGDLKIPFEHPIDLHKIEGLVKSRLQNTTLNIETASPT